MESGRYTDVYVLVLCGCYLQETDDSEPQLEDTVEPAQAASQPAEPLIPERDVPVTECLLTRMLTSNN